MNSLKELILLLDNQNKKIAEAKAEHKDLSLRLKRLLDMFGYDKVTLSDDCVLDAAKLLYVNDKISKGEL